jgi:drug/metabolite transporter (DMT)-like permease
MPVTAARATIAPARPSALDRFSVLLIAFAAMLWVSDAYFRNNLVSHLSASQIVVMEDALVTLFLLPFLVGGWRELRHLNGRQWLAVLIIGAGPQAIATWLFTQSFSHKIFAVTFLVQQTQPLIAITLAWVLLGERRRSWFWPLAALALVGVYLVVFARDPGEPLAVLQGRQVEAGAAERLQAGLLAFGAALLWAAGTVLGRFVLGRLSFQTTTALRFTVALPVLVMLVLLEAGLGGFTHYRFSDFVPNLLYIAVVPGLLGLLLYYRGLASTPASLATIAELTLPVTITFLASAPPPWGFSQPFYFPAQFVGAALFMGAVLALNWTKERAPVVVVPTGRAA